METVTIRAKRGLLGMLVAALCIAFFGASAATLATNQHALSWLDEHVHFDTQLKVNEGTYPHRGSLYEEEVVHEWACGVGHEAGPLKHGCNDPALDIRDVTSGQYTTGYIHYPTYFYGSEAFRSAVEFVLGPKNSLNIYRLFSAFLMTLGLVACTSVAYLAGVRGPGLVAASTLPVGATSITVMAGMINPSSTSILTGALIAGTTLAWILRNRGFIWVAMAMLAASSTAVINTLPAAGLLFAIVVIWIARRLRWRVAGEWDPKLWHLGVVGVLIVLPVIAWGRVIGATATASESQVSAAYQLSGWRVVAMGAIQELVNFHSPWTDWNLGMPAGPSAFSQALRVVASGLPGWVTIIVVGGLVAILAHNWASSRYTLNKRDGGGPHEDVEEAARGDFRVEPLGVLAVGTILGLALYPPALRISNALNFGIDFGIVTRYSMAFAPLVVILALVLSDNRRWHWVLAVMGVAAMVSAAGVTV